MPKKKKKKKKKKKALQRKKKKKRKKPCKKFCKNNFYWQKKFSVKEKEKFTLYKKNFFL